MNSKVKVTSANKLFFVFVVLFFSFSFIVSILTMVFPRISDYFIIAINEIVIILVPVILFSVYKQLDIKKVFKVNKLKLLPALLIILISFPASYVAGTLNNIVVYLLNFIGKVPAAQIPVPQSVLELVLGIIIVAVLPAICEEALNRGILLNAYEARGSYKAIFITGLFFGFFHFDITISYYYRFEPQPSFITISLSELLSIMQVGLVSLIAVVVLLIIFQKVTRETFVYRRSISNARGDIKSVLTHWPIILVLVLYVAMAGLYIANIAFL